MSGLTTTQLAERLAKRLDLESIPVDEVGAVIGAHVGPGTVAVLAGGLGVPPLAISVAGVPVGPTVSPIDVPFPGPLRTLVIPHPEIPRVPPDGRTFANFGLFAESSHLRAFRGRRAESIRGERSPEQVGADLKEKTAHL